MRPKWAQWSSAEGQIGRSWNAKATKANGTPATDTVGFRLFLRPLMPDRSHSAVGPSKQWFQTEINGSYKNWLSMVHTWTSMPHYAKMVRPLARGHIASTVREGRGQGVGGQEPE
jgi:hypothetical protein